MNRKLSMRVNQLSSFQLFFLIPALACCLLNTIDLMGQEVGIEYGFTITGYDNALENPAGLGGHLDIPIIRNVDLPFIEDIELRFGISKHTENITISRSRCTGLVEPGTNCNTDTFDGDSHLTRFGAGIVIGFKPFIPNVRSEIYALGTSTDLKADFIGRESGKNIGPITPTNNSIGLEFGGMVRYEVTQYLELYGRLAIQNANIQTCGADAWFAFCEERKFYQFTLGTQLRFSELL